MAGLFCFSTKAEQDALAAEIRQRGIRRWEFERFITTLESLPDQVTDFDETLWGSIMVTGNRTRVEELKVNVV